MKFQQKILVIEDDPELGSVIQHIQIGRASCRERV